MADPAAGALQFAEIPRLPDDWWDGTPKSDPDCVWTVWDRSTYYTWGANSGNYRQGPIGSLIGGGGMAGGNGPTRDRGLTAAETNWRRGASCCRPAKPALLRHFPMQGNGIHIEPIRPCQNAV
tara:strand:- start:2970 stop:3338 length:369 start_codon:yes stop_codon:yes gene_type:complete